MKNKKLQTQLLQTGVSLIPGVGQYLAPLVGALAQPDSPVSVAKTKLTTNPYGADAGISSDIVPPANNSMFDNINTENIIKPLPTFNADLFTPGATATDNTLVTSGQELSLGKNLSVPTSPNVSFKGKINNTSTPAIDATMNSNTANAIGLALKGVALGGSIADALKNPEEEKLILPNYTKADQYIKSANIDYTQAKQDALGVSNIAASMNRALSSNAAGFQGREQARLAGLTDAISRVSEAENNAQSQLNLTKGNYEQQKAVDTAGRQYQNQQGNMQNDAASRLFDRNLMSDLSQIGTSFNQYAETNKINQNNLALNKFNTTQALSLLQSKYPGWTIDPQIMDQFKSGKIGVDEFLKYTPPGFETHLKTN